METNATLQTETKDRFVNVVGIERACRGSTVPLRFSVEVWSSQKLSHSKVWMEAS